MTLDVAALVAPVSEETPAGPDLSDDPERIEIESAFERSVSVDGEGESTTDWNEVIGRIVAQAEKTRDIWLAVYLMRAAALGKRFELLVDGAQLLAGLVEERWADAYPQLDDLGFIGRKTPCEALTGFIGRKTPCEALTRRREFLDPLRNLPLLEHPRLGRYSGADIQRFVDQGAQAEGFGMFRALLEATSSDDLGAIVERFDALRDSIGRVDTVMTERAEGDTATNFAPTYEALNAIRAGLASFLPAADGAGPASGEESGLPAASDDSVAGSAQAFGGAVRSREDVVRAIDAICAYYARFEPGSPVPLVLARARDWIGLDFMAVLNDIAPGSIDEAGRILRSGTGSASPVIAPVVAVVETAPEASGDDSSW
jgi:type VI secretion system protein ImpA